MNDGDDGGLFEASSETFPADDQSTVLTLEPRECPSSLNAAVAGNQGE
jgi:hypothetical protein